MDERLLASNSNKLKQHVKSAEEAFDDKKIRQVAKGKTKKRSVAKRFTDVFLSEDIGNVKEYIIFDVLIPTVKDGLVDMLQKGTEMLFYGRTRGNRSRNKNGGTYISYNNYSSGSIKPASNNRGRSLYQYQDIVLETRAEAEDVIEMLQEILDKYKQVTVADLYDVCGVTGNGYTDNQYGWLELRGAGVQRCREGYLLNLPRAIDLD